jgi:hypothetical protein
VSRDQGEDEMPSAGKDCTAKRVAVWDLELADSIARRLFRAFPVTFGGEENKHRLLGVVRRAIDKHVAETGETE